MKKFGKMSLIFEFSLSKVRLYGNFHENLWKKNFDQFFRTLLTNRGKNEIEDEKYEKINSILNSLYQN